MSPMSLMVSSYLGRLGTESMTLEKGRIISEVHTTRIDRETMIKVDKTEGALPLWQCGRTQHTWRTKA